MMTVIEDVLDAVRALAQATNPYATITRAALPPENGISIFLGAGRATNTFMTKSMRYSLDVVLNGKHSNEATVRGDLCKIHDALVKATSYTSATGYQITSIITATSPTRIEREANGQILYGSALTVTFYYR